MSTQETEVENDAQDNATPNGSLPESPPPTLTRTNTEEAINDAFALYIRSSQFLDDKGKSSSAPVVSQNPISKRASLDTVVTAPDDSDDAPASLPKRLNRILPSTEPQREPSILVGYPPSVFQQSRYSSPEPSNSLLGYANPEVTIQSPNQFVHDTDLARYPVDTQASDNDTGLLTVVGTSNFTTPLSVTSTLYAHDPDKGKGKAVLFDGEVGSPSPQFDEDEDGDFNLTDLERDRIATAWKRGETTRTQLGEAGPSRMPYTSQVEEDEEKSDFSEELDTSTRRIGKCKSGDDDEFIASSDEEYSKSQDSEWSLSLSASPPPVKVKCRKAPKRKFSDSSSDESEQPTKRKRFEKAVYPSPRRVNGPRGKKIEEEDYEDSDEFISSPRTAAGTFKSSLGKRKRMSTRDEAPVVQRKRTSRIVESPDNDDHSSAAESVTPEVKRKTKRVKSSKTQNSDPGPLIPCPEKCGKAFLRQTDLKRHVRSHPPSKYTVQWLQAHNEDLSKGLLSSYGCAVPGCTGSFGRRDALTRHHRINHKSLYAKDPKSDIMQAKLGYANVTRFMVQE